MMSQSSIGRYCLFSCKSALWVIIYDLLHMRKWPLLWYVCNNWSPCCILRRYAWSNNGDMVLLSVGLCRHSCGGRYVERHFRRSEEASHNSRDGCWPQENSLPWWDLHRTGLFHNISDHKGAQRFLPPPRGMLRHLVVFPIVSSRREQVCSQNNAVVSTAGSVIAITCFILTRALALLT